MYDFHNIIECFTDSGYLVNCENHEVTALVLVTFGLINRVDGAIFAKGRPENFFTLHGLMYKK